MMQQVFVVAAMAVVFGGGAASAAPAALPSAEDAVADLLQGQCLADQTHADAAAGSINARAVGRPAGPQGAALQLSPSALRIPTANGEAYYQNDNQACVVYAQGLDAPAAAGNIEKALHALPGRVKKAVDTTSTGANPTRTMAFLIGDEGLPALPLVTVVYPLANPHMIVASVRISRQINLTADSTPGWQPTDEQGREVVDTIHRYLDAKDHGRSAEVYSMFADSLKQKQSQSDFKDAMAQFNSLAGPVKERRIVRIAWSKDPADLPPPGIYAAADLVSKFNGIELDCSYLVLYQPPEGGPFVVVREDTAYLDNGEVRRIRAAKSQAAVDALWKQTSDVCPNYPGPDPAN